jgi:hypothetical protein
MESAAASKNFLINSAWCITLLPQLAAAAKI